MILLWVPREHTEVDIVFLAIEPGNRRPELPKLCHTWEKPPHYGFTFRNAPKLQLITGGVENAPKEQLKKLGGKPLVEMLTTFHPPAP
jgi:hypothetical protein